jgi:hypothetical protein
VAPSSTTRNWIALGFFSVFALIAFIAIVLLCRLEERADDWPLRFPSCGKGSARLIDPHERGAC